MRVLAALLAAATLPAACADAEPPLRVLAAASLTEAFGDIAEAFEAAAGEPVELSLAGSQTLVTQLAEGIRADVLATADTDTMDGARAGGLVGDPHAFASNELIVIVPSSNPAGIDDPADLAAPVRLVVAAAEVPAGRYTRAALGRLGLADAVLRNVVSEEEDVKGVVGKVASGEADAGIVYRTDLGAQLEDRLDAVELGAADVVASYPIAVTTASERPQVAAAFVDFVLHGDGAVLLRDAGFGPPR